MKKTPTWQPSWIKKLKDLFYQSLAESIFHRARLLICICQAPRNSAMILPPTFKNKSDLTSLLAEISEWWSFKFLQKRKILARSAAKCHRSVSRVIAKIHAKLAPVITDITIWCWWKPSQKLLSNIWSIFNNKTKDCKINGMDSAKESMINWRNLMASKFWIIKSCGSATETCSSNMKRISCLMNSKITNNYPSWASKEWEPSWRSCTSKQVGQISLLHSKATLPPTTWSNLVSSWTLTWHQKNPTQSSLAPRRRQKPSWIKESSEVSRLAIFQQKWCWSIWTQSWTKKWKSRRQTNVCHKWQPSSDLSVSPSCSN